jgi:glycosyltransferase involved in cell wall biosynthesis
MRVAIVKPSWGITGGFEVLMSRVERELTERGHEVGWHHVQVQGVPDDPFGMQVPERLRTRAWEAFRYFGMVEAFRAVDTSEFDLILSTQPPSFAAEHPHHLALFSHHLRLYYDLSDTYIEAGFADARDHQLAQAAVRRVDERYMHNPGYFLATSEVVRDRLHRYNGLDGRVGVFHAVSPVAEQQLAEPVPDTYEHPMCVSRHEWPKRTELFVHAMKYLPATQGTCVGSGGRLAFVRALDARLSGDHADLDDVEPHELWLNTGEAPPFHAQTTHSNVRFLTDVREDRDLADLYGAALCVVAPAYLEDYGLTAIEAMAFGKPLVVCDDGGGLTTFVEDGVNGFIVPPVGAAIAEAVQRFVDDPSLARSMGAAARERAMQYTWARATREIEDGIARVTS